MKKQKRNNNNWYHRDNNNNTTVTCLLIEQPTRNRFICRRIQHFKLNQEEWAEVKCCEIEFENKKKTQLSMCCVWFLFPCCRCSTVDRVVECLRSYFSSSPFLYSLSIYPSVLNILSYWIFINLSTSTLFSSQTDH